MYRESNDFGKIGCNTIGGTTQVESRVTLVCVFDHQRPVRQHLRPKAAVNVRVNRGRRVCSRRREVETVIKRIDQSRSRDPRTQDQWQQQQQQ